MCNRNDYFNQYSTCTHHQLWLCSDFGSNNLINRIAKKNEDSNYIAFVYLIFNYLYFSFENELLSMSYNCLLKIQFHLFYFHFLWIYCVFFFLFASYAMAQSIQLASIHKVNIWKGWTNAKVHFLWTQLEKYSTTWKTEYLKKKLK